MVRTHEISHIESSKRIQTALLRGSYKSPSSDASAGKNNDISNKFSRVGPKFTKYMKMLNSGVPQGAVEISMRVNGDYFDLPPNAVTPDPGQLSPLDFKETFSIQHEDNSSKAVGIGSNTLTRSAFALLITLLFVVILML